MALTQTDKNEIEVLIRKEIKDFLGQSSIKQYEDKLIDSIAREIKRGKLEDEVKDIVIRVFREFYNTMWTNRSHWESRLKNS
jgi:sulfur relay (sulfurtransferase) DsrC/TusE family protein